MSSSMLPFLESRDLPLWGQPPPAPRSRESNNPTLLFSWWCTIFSGTLIITRLCGRKVRSNHLFKEDWIMMAALIPLLIRMGFMHVVLLYGTNNVATVGETYTTTELYQRSVGARLVLAARIFYAMFIWISKLTISEFLKRITIRIWRRSYEVTLQGIRIFLGITFIVVVIATLTECQPFDHYWQVVPDPGPHCRQGYGNLIAMGTCDMITDILLVAFPIPIILQSGQSWGRKIQLVLLFSLSLVLIAITGTRVPKVIEFAGRQQYRTVWASCEILASAAVSNAVILGSFLRDKGTKRNKYKSGSVSDSIDRNSVRRPTVTALQNTGSEEDLFRFLGIRVPDHLQDIDEEGGPRAAPMATPAVMSSKRPNGAPVAHPILPEPSVNSGSSEASSDMSLPKQRHSEAHAPALKRDMSFFDVGGLLETGVPDPPSEGRRLRVSTLVEGTVAQDFASTTPTQSRRGSRALLQDLGGFLTPTASRTSSGMDRYTGRRQSDSHLHPPSRHTGRAPAGVLGPHLERHETNQSLQDPGGLLFGIPESNSPAGYRRAMSIATETPAARPPPRQREETSPAAQQMELQDLGGILSSSHEPDASALALQRTTSSRSRSQRRRSHQLTPQNLPPPTLAPPSPGWDDMTISDAGGLLGK